MCESVVAWLCQLMIDFENSVTFRLTSKFVIMLALTILLQLKYVFAFPCNMCATFLGDSGHCLLWYFAPLWIFQGKVATSDR